MKLSPGDTIQIILTVGGVPYAKTRVVEQRKHHSWLPLSPYEILEDMMNELYGDIDQYGDEHEEVERAEEGPQSFTRI